MVLLSLAAYSNSFADAFALDWAPILQDARIRSVSARNIGDIFRHTYFWPHGEAGIYRPLTTLSWLFNYTILGDGDNAAGYHWINWLLHAANVLLVFAVVRKLAGRLRTAFLAAGLWSVHPVLTEAVTNVAGRADLLAATAVLGGFLLYLRSRDTTGGRRVAWLSALSAVAAAGACAKESAVVLPGVILLYEAVWWRAARLRNLAAGLVATALPIAAFLILRAEVLASSLPAEFPFVDNPIVGAPFWQGRLTAVCVLARYLWLTIWPARLSCDYSWSEIPLATGTAADWIAVAIVAAALLGAILAWRRSGLVPFLAGFALVSILPASNLLFSTGTIMAERLLYLPSAGLVAILVVAVEALSARLPRPAVAAATICGVLAAGYSVRTFVRNFDWQDDYRIAMAGLETSPHSFKLHRLVADYLLKTNPSPSNISRIVAEADKSVTILDPLPDERNMTSPWNVAADAHLAKADICAGKDARPDLCGANPASAVDYERAAQLALRSTRIEAAARAAWNREHGTRNPPAPTAAEGYRILAAADLRLVRPEDAMAAATQARTIDPSNPEAYAEIANAYLGERRGEDAAIVLVEGMSATENPGLREDLITLYKRGVDTEGCAVVDGPRGPALNPSCAIVRRDFCAAAARVQWRETLEQFDCAKLP